MAIKRFKPVDYSKYITIEDFEKKLKNNSPTYGEYIVSKILTVDYIKACEDMVLGPVSNFYDSLRSELGMTKVVGLETKRFTGQNLSKFEVYTAIPDDNIDWVDPRGKSKRLPVALSKEYITELISKMIKNNF